MPSQSEVSICNLAMTRLGTSRIESLSDNNENAIKCNAVYSFIRDNMIANHNWNFALKEAELSVLVETPELDDWAYKFQLPTDCLRVVRYEYDPEYRVVADTIYSNYGTCKIEYVAQITDPTKFPPFFATALGGEIASELAFGITQNAAAAKGAALKAKKEIADAKWSDSQEGLGINRVGSSFIDARKA